MTDVAKMARNTLEEYLARDYPFTVHADPAGGYVIVYPDLPGCMTQVERLEEIGAAAEEIRTLWIETEYEDGKDIPLPSYPEGYSGKFNLRLPRSLHRMLVEGAECNSVSLNTYVAGLLERGHTQAGIERAIDGLEARLNQRFQGLEAQLEAMQESLRYRPANLPKASPKYDQFQRAQAEVERSRTGDLASYGKAA